MQRIIKLMKKILKVIQETNKTTNSSKKLQELEYMVLENLDFEFEAKRNTNEYSNFRLMMNEAVSKVSKSMSDKEYLAYYRQLGPRYKVNVYGNADRKNKNRHVFTWLFGSRYLWNIGNSCKRKYSKKLYNGVK